MKESSVGDPILDHQHGRLPRSWLSFLEVKNAGERQCLRTTEKPQRWRATPLRSRRVQPSGERRFPYTLRPVVTLRPAHGTHWVTFAEVRVGKQVDPVTASEYAAADHARWREFCSR